MINRSRRLPFLETYQEFSIAVVRSGSWRPSPDTLDAARPITARLVSDMPALFVADPFLVHHMGSWLLFFEAMDSRTLKGRICVASSADLVTWDYGGIVLDLDCHVSFPHVFSWEGEWYMVPETSALDEVRVYRATAFPHGWTHERTLLRGRYSDSVLFESDGSWFMFTSPRMEELRLFTAPNPLGDWSVHPASPIVADDLGRARPAGPVIRDGDCLVRIAQDCRGTYGRAVWSFLLSELSGSTYAEEPVLAWPALGAGKPRWRRNGMHHLSAIQDLDQSWVVAVDGWRTRRRLARMGTMARELLGLPPGGRARTNR